MNLSEFVAILEAKGFSPHKNGSGLTSKCPGHEDRNASLSVSEGTDGKVLLKCHAGCDFGSIVMALGLKPSDLFPAKEQTTRTSGSHSRIVAVYDYSDEEGRLVFQVVRLEPKSFRQRRPDPSSLDGWTWRVKETRRVPYRLPEVIEAVQAGHAIWIVEGEKDADALAKVGLTATCNPGGAGKWLPGFNSHFAGAHVVVIADKDQPGRAHAAQVAAGLKQVAGSVRVIEVPDFGGRACKDVSDFLAAGGSHLELVVLADDAPEWEAPSRDAAASAGDPLAELPEGTDAQRAKLFVDRFGPLLRFVPEWERWIVFEDGRWKSRNDGGLVRLSCVLACEVMSKSADIKGTSEDVRAELKRLAAISGSFASAAKVTSMATFARADPRVIIRPEDLDADPWLVGTPDGVIDLRTGTMHPHSPGNLVTKVLGTNFDPHAKAPTWEKFLARVIPDEGVRAYVQKAVGYSLTGVTTEHHFVFLHGIGHNGKSTFVETIFDLFGTYAGRAAETLLYETRRGDTPPDVIAEIAGVRFLAGCETREGARLNEGAIKDVTGGDTLRGARKYEHGFAFRPVAKLWIAGNHRPAIRGNDDGIWRRVRMVNFPVQIPAGERDAGLAGKLRGELPGILNWAIAGCLRWQEEGLAPPESVVVAVQGYRADEDVLGEFLDDRTEQFGPSCATHRALFEAYQDWSGRSGVRYPLSSRILAQRLRERGWQDGKDPSGSLVWRGVRLCQSAGGAS